MPRQNLIYWFKNIWALQIEYLLQSGCLKVSIINTVILYYLPYARSRDTTCYWPGFLASLINRKLTRDQTRNSGKALLGPLLQQGEREQATGSLACSFSLSGGTSLFLILGEGRGVSRNRLEGWLRWYWVQGAHAVPCFLLWALQKWQLGFLGSLYLLSRICPNCKCTQLFLVAYSFVVFCCWKRGVSRCKHCSTAAKPVSFRWWSISFYWETACKTDYNLGWWVYHNTNKNRDVEEGVLW